MVGANLGVKRNVKENTLMRRSGRSASALGLAIGALSTLIGCPQDPLAEARALEQRGESIAAAEAFRLAAKRDSANLAAWDGAVRLYCEELARVGECLSTLDLELDLIGNVARHTAAYASALEQRARARLESGMAAEAEADIERALRVTPDRASLFVVRARARLARGQREEAEKDLSRARQLDPNQAEANEVVKTLREGLEPQDTFGGPAED